MFLEFMVLQSHTLFRYNTSFDIMVGVLARLVMKMVTGGRRKLPSKQIRPLIGDSVEKVRHGVAEQRIVM
jgi:hypothetical protein